MSIMISLNPVPPTSLSALAREVLDLLNSRPAAADIVLGGGVALAHYLDYRDTYDPFLFRSRPAIDGSMRPSMLHGRRSESRRSATISPRR
ncbi:MAG: hypothetical protein ACKO40_07390 [Planctomycetaceae bacterium]